MNDKIKKGGMELFEFLLQDRVAKIDEYIRLGYRLSKDFYDIKPQYNIFDYEEEEWLHI